jgi:hypothetical protein
VTVTNEQANRRIEKAIGRIEKAIEEEQKKDQPDKVLIMHLVKEVRRYRKILAE